MIANAFESEANARRIAATPDMEKALESLLVKLYSLAKAKDLT